MTTFAIGQVWEARGEKDIFNTAATWKIIAITDHPESPIIAQADCGAAREYRANGCYGRSIGDLDLVKLLEDVK